jgi:hypothetical protein
MNLYQCCSHDCEITNKRIQRLQWTQISSILCEKYHIKSNLVMSNSKEPHISLRVKEYSSNQSYLINVLYLLHLDIYLKSIYPGIRITRVQNNKVFCIINIICKCIRISLLSWLHTYSILIHDGCHIWTRGYWHLRIIWLQSLFLFVQVCEDQ